MTAYVSGILDASTPFRLILPNATIENGEVSCDLTSFAGGAGLFTTLHATGATTLDTSATVGTTLAVAGASTLHATGVTTLTASGLVAAAAAVTVGTTLGVTGASTLAAVTCTTLSTSSNVSMVLPTYASNALAILGGLAVTRLYQTVTGEVRIVV